MNAHTCHYCDDIVLDLTDPKRYRGSRGVEQRLDLEIEFVKLAIKNKCRFFYWACALHEGDIPDVDIDAFLDEHIANLPGVVYEGSPSGEETGSDGSGSGWGEDSDSDDSGDEDIHDASQAKDEEGYAAARNG